MSTNTPPFSGEVATLSRPLKWPPCSTTTRFRCRYRHPDPLTYGPDWGTQRRTMLTASRPSGDRCLPHPEQLASLSANGSHKEHSPPLAADGTVPRAMRSVAPRSTASAGCSPRAQTAAEVSFYESNLRVRLSQMPGTVRSRTSAYRGCSTVGTPEEELPHHSPLRA